MSQKISQMTAAGTLVGTEQLEVSQLSTTVTITAGTLSALAIDNSYNDSASGFVTAGFAVNDTVRVTGFTGSAVNNIFSGVITALTAAKMSISGADGDVIVDDAAGESVTITRWLSRRVPRSDLVPESSRPVNPQTGVTYALLSTDRGKRVTLSNAASIAASIAQAGTSGFADGYFTYIEVIGVGAATITPTTSTINGATTLVLTSGMSAILFSDGANYRAMVFDAPGLAVNLQTGTTYTFLSGDRSKLVTHSNAAAIADTLPQATGAFGSGWFTWVQNRGAGTLTITPTTSTIDGAASLALTTGQGVLIVSDGTNYYTMRGINTRVGMPFEKELSLSDLTTAITAGTTRAYFRPAFAATQVSYRASLRVASSSGLPTIDMNKNGVSMATTTKLTIDATELTSQTASAAVVMTTTTWAIDDLIELDIDVSGTGAMGLIVTVTGTYAP